MDSGLWSAAAYVPLKAQPSESSFFRRLLAHGAVEIGRFPAFLTLVRSVSNISQIIYRCMVNFRVSINKSEIACSENPSSRCNLQPRALLKHHQRQRGVPLPFVITYMIRCSSSTSRISTCRAWAQGPYRPHEEQNRQPTTAI